MTYPQGFEPLPDSCHTEMTHRGQRRRVIVGTFTDRKGTRAAVFIPRHQIQFADELKTLEQITREARKASPLA